MGNCYVKKAGLTVNATFKMFIWKLEKNRCCFFAVQSFLGVSVLVKWL